MKSKNKIRLCIAIFTCFALASPALAQRQMEKLGRGVVAVNQGDGKVFVSWRMLGTEPDDIAFNLYRITGNAPAVKLNDEPITKCTWHQDAGVDLTQDNAYFVRPLLNGKEGLASSPFFSKVAANSAGTGYFSIPLQTPQGYSPNDASVGDLDGDGEYEIILHQTGRAQDNSGAGYTDAPIFQAYKMDGTLMWTINLGKNIREGAHYTQFMVADFDGDGRAEMICKTADGTTDGTGVVIGDPEADWVAKEGTANHRDTTGSERGPDRRMMTNPDGTHVFSFVGRILSGPEYLTVFDGLTGKALDTVDYIPGRGEGDAGWGDSYGNRSERYLAGVAYLDGKLPSAVMCRGYYARTVLAAWNWRDGKLTNVWVFDSNDPEHRENRRFGGQGNHSLSVADVDADGKDEIVYGGMCVDDNGKGLWTTGLYHGDALHVSDLDPSRPGLEVFGIHEGGRTAGAALLDARTGEVIWGTENKDTGRGLAADVDPRLPGAEFFGGPGGAHDVAGNVIQVKGGNNFAIWWDGDLLRELLNGNTISKWDWESKQVTRIFTAEGCRSNNGTKSTPTLSGDLFGDWREELIESTRDNKELRIFTTTIPTDYRVRTLMHDPQYRAAIAWQNVGYNQPPHPGFFLGADMKAPSKPKIQVVEPGVTIHLAGDSTVMTYEPTSKQEGWGQQLGQFFNDKVSIDNQAKGGANVQTFKTGGRWNNIITNLKAGDYVLIQFGANDSGTAHGPVFPNDYAALLGQMADEVKAKGGTPVFVTPSAFYQWKNGKQDNTRLAPYREATLAAGAANDVQVVDLNARGVEYLNSLGQQDAMALYMPSRGTVDKAHFVKAGSSQMAEFVAEELRRIQSPLTAYLK